MKSPHAAPPLVEQLERSTLFQNYQRAFGEATGLPLRLASTGEWRSSLRAACFRNPGCDLLAGKNQACSACSRSQRIVAGNKEAGHYTSTCFAALCVSHVAIRAGEKTIEFLLTGEIATRKPTRAGFAGIVRKLREWGGEFDEAQLRQAYFATRVVSEAQYRSILDLLAIFSGHLSLILGQLSLRNRNSEAPYITRAKEFIGEHSAEPLSLQQVAERAHLSSCYFCRKFKDTTGLSFTEYVARTRVEAAKNLLINPQVRISEVAFEVGFQSLTHFNRVFRDITGQSPTKFREDLPKPAPETCEHLYLRTGRMRFLTSPPAHTDEIDSHGVNGGRNGGMGFHKNSGAS